MVFRFKGINKLGAKFKLLIFMQGEKRDGWVQLIHHPIEGGLIVWNTVSLLPPGSGFWYPCRC